MHWIDSIYSTRSLLYFVQVFEKYSQEIFKTSCSAKISSFSNMYRYFILRVANLQSIWEAGKQYCEKTFFDVLNYQSHILFLLFYRELFDQLKVEEPISNIPIFCYAALSLAYQENVVFAMQHPYLFLCGTLTYLSRKYRLCHQQNPYLFLLGNSHLPIRKMSSLP